MKNPVASWKQTQIHLILVGRNGCKVYSEKSPFQQAIDFAKVEFADKNDRGLDLIFGDEIEKREY